MKIFTAFQNGRTRTRLTVVKDRHSGSSVTQALTRDNELGVGAPSQISEIIIVEIPLK